MTPGGFFPLAAKKLFMKLSIARNIANTPVFPRVLRATASPVEFRGLKQTLGRAKLRCRNDRRLLVELDWSIMAMAVAELFALKEQLTKKPRIDDPSRKATEPASEASREQYAQCGFAFARPTPCLGPTTIYRHCYARPSRTAISAQNRSAPIPSSESRQKAVTRTEHAQGQPSRAETTMRRRETNGRINPSRCCPTGLTDSSHIFPRVGRRSSGQPLAKGHNPVGIECRRSWTNISCIAAHTVALSQTVRGRNAAVRI